MSETFSALSERARSHQQIFRKSQMSKTPFLVRAKVEHTVVKEKRSGRIIVV